MSESIDITIKSSFQANGLQAAEKAFAQLQAAQERATAASAKAAAAPGNAVTSPMVGTVYLAAEPGAAPFVKPGDRVSEGQTLLIIEAMKVMNPIKSPRAGTVAAVYVKNSEPVEFGQPLVAVE
ncbi:MAG: acetyl-CoA carboxylase biotin carboxyl carrier protein [Alphaproteobacteria bacterium]